MRLEGKVSIITGAGSGIGREAAMLFAREGAKVVVADVIAKDGEETVGLVKKAGGDAAFVQVDVSKATEVENMARLAADTYGKVNVLVNNAAINNPSEDPLITELAEDVWEKIINTNLKSIYLCCKYVIPDLLESGGGSIMNVASNAGLVGLENPSYGASKGGVIALTRVIARQYGDKNIRVNAICPARVDTPQLARAMVIREKRPPQFPTQQNLLRRAGQPVEIAYLALYLASDESSFVTGAILPIDGGYTAV